MICPACDSNLDKISIEDIELDVCNNGCGGIWFDNFELQKMDESHEFTDENLIELLSIKSKLDPDQSKKFNCPKCKDIVMMRHFWSTRKQIVVDHCPKCAGYWLDEGELFKIRHQYRTEGERKDAASDYYASFFDYELSLMRQESKEKAEHAHRIANMFRLVSPRFYFSKVKNW